MRVLRLVLCTQPHSNPVRAEAAQNTRISKEAPTSLGRARRLRNRSRTETGIDGGRMGLEVEFHRRPELLDAHIRGGTQAQPHLTE